MLSSEWGTFFGIIVGAATGLAGLLFVAFSIYVANRRIDLLAQRLGSLYFAEILTSLTIGLAAILPPHAWWAGALFGALGEIAWWMAALRTATRYRTAFRTWRNEKSSNTESQEQVLMYEASRSQVNTLFVPLCESLLVLACGAAGALAYFTVLPSFIPTWLPLQLAGFFAAWYLISATANAWFFLFRLNQFQALSRTSS